ncbi:RnfABCDGE type electron transport complex subunit G [uncultured Rikenella sp.]|uniref:RnfABCDGE type electron transport complex subunit G n=1 Tax=uncultured Rikenella sp. TaxID=368003 RepID=UPI0026399EB9|nr:RnfABCDGE type electron transport complex subunit G [uncultured Rikenella sp.]
MVIVLGTITLVASAAVGGIYLLTKEPIEATQAKKVNDAIAQVVPNFDNTPATEAIKTAVDGKDTVTIYPAKSGGAVVGYAIETFSKKGFGGEMSLMVGFLPDGTIKDISVISHNETPGLGDKIQKTKSDFAVQFEGKNPSTFKLAVKKDGGDVDAITASTISSRAFTDAVARAYQVFQAVLNDTEVEVASGATATQHTASVKKETPGEAEEPAQTLKVKEEKDFEFDPNAVEGALPYDAAAGATATDTTGKGGTNHE